MVRILVLGLMSRVGVRSLVAGKDQESGVKG